MKELTSDEKRALYSELIATRPEIEQKGAANAYTSVNGHMFSILSAAGLFGLRLPKDEREKFLQKYKTNLLEQYGVVQKEYVTVPDALLKKTGELKKYLEISYEYVKGLKPKPTTKKKGK